MARYRSSNAIIRSDVPHASSSSGPRPSAPSTGGKGKTSFHGGVGSKGLGVTPHKRHRKILRDNIQGVTKGDIRRMARRGGIKRIAGGIYEETRLVLRKRLEVLLKDIAAVVELSGRKTVCVTDVVFVLNRVGNPIYGFGDGER
ncbi:histon H4 like protein [Zymoseptoria brevis]|uniref:Histone H4 n=1 Tax=Zymoseptoria brevis TaxID=1047168 RepID=A0A0F4GES0_9PEZI|nr:histon H4 like protein [Zymoseptoria brevis]